MNSAVVRLKRYNFSFYTIILCVEFTVVHVPFVFCISRGLADVLITCVQCLCIQSTIKYV